ncbi:MAG: glycosyltransferase family 2 protein [Rhodocyclaceae bacterium]|nr:glycosyltransferase family 2 protein [Rhodocyclaceae bacterium]
MSRLPLSAVLITRNAAAQFPACLESLAFCAEIVVVDSGSTDETVEIAQAAGARVIHQDWLGYGPQKQFAVDQAAHDWVLCVDADERVSERLRERILAVLPALKEHAGPPQVLPGPLGGGRGLAATSGGAFFHAYRFPRCNRFLGRYLRHGEGYPDWSLRLFDRRHARWSDDVVHEKVVADGPVGTLAGDLLHDSAETLEHYLAKQDRYTTLAAKAALAAGKRASLARLLFSPSIRFVKFFFLRLGFLDGLPGLVHILIGCRNSHAKYVKMRGIQRNTPRGIPS